MADTRSECPCYHGFFQVTSSGLLRVHGPVHNRCAGSRVSPVDAAAPAQSEFTVAQTPRPRGAAISDASRDCDLAVDLDQLFAQRQPQVIRRIPKGSRESASKKLCEILEDILSTNSNEAWTRRAF